MADQWRPGRGRSTSLAIWSLVLLAPVMLAACRSAPPPPSPSGGVYTSSKYDFRVTYPNGWQVSTPSSTTSSSIVPLEIVITRVAAEAAGGAQVSSFTLAVYNAKDSLVASQITQLRQEAQEPNSPPHIKPVTISGKMWYQDASEEVTVPGTQVTDTHTDYYLVTSGYEYQISIDALSSDNAATALQAMLSSFALIS